MAVRPRESYRAGSMQAIDTPRDDGRRAPLPSNRAFVVQFEAGRSDDPVCGRAEHLASGQAARFESWGELRAFLLGRLEGIEKRD